MMVKNGRPASLVVNGHVLSLCSYVLSIVLETDYEENINTSSNWQSSYAQVPQLVWSSHKEAAFHSDLHQDESHIWRNQPGAPSTDDPLKGTITANLTAGVETDHLLGEERGPSALSDPTHFEHHKKESKEFSQFLGRLVKIFTILREKAFQNFSG